MATGPLFGPRLTASYMSPSALRQAAYAQQLIGNAGDTSPTDMWGGIARVGQGLIGGYFANKAGDKEKAYQEALAQALGAADPLAALKTAAQSNPDLAPAATQFTMANFAQKQNLANQLEVMRAQQQMQKVSPLTAPELAQLGLPAGTVAQKDATGKISIINKPPDWKDPNYVDTQKQIRAAGATRVAVDASQKGDQELAKLDAKTVSELGEGVRKMREIMPDLNRVEKALEVASTGPTANIRKTLGALAQEFGVKVGPETSELEIISSIQSRLAPAMRAVGSGASSDRDVAMFLDGLPNLMRTPEGNRLVIQNLRKITERKQQEEQFMRQWYRKNNSSLDGVYEAMDKQFGPLFSPQERQAMAAGGGGAPAATPQVQPGAPNTPPPPPGFQVVQ